MTTSQRQQLPDLEDPPDAATVRELVRQGYKAEIVQGWPRSKAVTVLEARRKEENALLRKRASEEGETPPPERPTSAAEREEAAGYLETALSKPGVGELQLSLSYCQFALSDSEAKRLAGWLVKMFRGQT